ncbi:hypothetical protein IFR04_003945 [Cadophora malorum]|uniref:Uncharacterized protein n=1 Tax=Cadophora malorum TaxID=108018 RepID=A0A8H7WDM4_9HELO|nr:hypothetical protein IFR04_003945 [Cadophora malorum]
MAQQGGTWDPKKIRRQQTDPSKNEASSGELSQEKKLMDFPTASQSQVSKTDGQDWDLVKDPTEESEPEPEPRGDGISSQFNFQVGWGKWKWDLFKWDVNVRKAGRQAEEAVPSSSYSTGKKDDAEQADSNEEVGKARTGRAGSRAADVLNKRADDEWVVVMYDNGSGDQCGGISNQDVTGKKEGLCKRLGSLVGKICTDVKVGINIGVAKCDFSFRTDSSV